MTSRRMLLTVLALLLCAHPRVGSAQGTRSVAEPTIPITGEVEKSQTLRLADLARMPRKQVQVTDRDGKVGTYEGVLVSDLLKAAGAPSGPKLRGPNMTNCVLTEARDGYRVVFALAEFDPAFTDPRAIVADTVNGQALPESEGPFRIVLPCQKRRARWIRMLQKLEVVKLHE